MWKSLSVIAALAAVAFAQQGQPMATESSRPDAPALAARGKHRVGVKTLNLNDTARKRNLTLELWYPTNSQNPERATYNTSIGAIPFVLVGQAIRDAAPLAGPFPLLLVSHGQPGNRFMMTYLTEHLASRGFVVAAIDHTGSTYSDVSQQSYISSLQDRPLDVLFALDNIAKIAPNANSNSVGLLGYSYGGYSVLNAAGVGLSKTDLSTYCQANNNEGPCFALPFFDGLAARASANTTPDPRIKGVFVMAPYGGPWLSAQQLQGMRTPLFVACGSADDVAVCARDSRRIYNQSGATPKHFLTLEGAMHNPWVNAPPAEARANANEFERWAEPVWDKERSHDITKHFASAFFESTLGNNADAQKFLTPTLEGFKPRSTAGIKLEVGR